MSILVVWNEVFLEEKEQLVEYAALLLCLLNIPAT